MISTSKDSPYFYHFDDAVRQLFDGFTLIDSVIKEANRRFFLMIYFWLATSFLVIFSYTRNLFIRPTDDPKELILYFACSLLILFTLKYKRINSEKVNINPLAFFSILYLFYMAINPLLTEAPFNEGIVVCGRIVLLVFTIKVLSQFSINQFQIIFKGLIAFGVLAVIASHYYISQSKIIMFLPIGHVSYFSDFLLLLLPWGFYFAFVSPQKYQKVIFFLASLFFLAEIMFKARRAPLVAILIAFALVTLLFLIHSRRKKLVLFVLLGVGVVTFGFVAGGHYYPGFEIKRGWQRLSDTFKNIGSGEYKENRFTMIERTFEAFGEKPLFGWGYGNFKFAYPKFYRPGDHDLSIFDEKIKAWLMHPHNEILFQLFEGGIVGLTFFLIPIGFLSFFLVKKLRQEKDQQIIFPLIFGLVAIFVSTQFTTSATNPVIRLVLVPYFALAYCLIKPDLPLWNFRISRLSKLIFPFRLLLIFLGLAVLGYNLSSYFLTQTKITLYKGLVPYQHRWAQILSPGQYDTLVRSAIIELGLEHEQKAEKLLRKAHRSFPYVPRPIQQLASLYLWQKRYDEAKEILLQGHQMYPFFAPFNDLLKQVQENVQDTKP